MGVWSSFPRTAGRRAASAACAAALALMLGACSGFNLFGSDEPPPVVDIPAEKLFNEGLASYENRDFITAAKSFAELEKQYPYSALTKRGLLLTIAGQYQSREYTEAITNGQRFLQVYPSDKDAPYVQYIVGMSYFNQIPDITRDQDRAERALAIFRDLISRYPQSEYVADARERIRIANDQLAGREMEVGRYYLNQRNYTGSINRFREVLIRYQTTRHTEEALARLAEAYLAMGVVDEAQTAGAVLGHNFPDSQWYKDTFALLQSGGLAPRENTASWISRLFRGLTGG